MTQHRAVLDFIGLPISAPGNLECRFQKGSFRDDGTWIDDGSRSGPMQHEKHRVVLSRGQNVRRIISGMTDHLAKMGYEPPDIGLIRHVARHEWRHDIIAARRERLKVQRPELRLVVRALGFDIEGKGQLAIGLGKATVRPDGASLTQKSGVLLHPGDSLPLLFEALDLLAERIGYEPMRAEDRSLIEHVARRLWTNEAVDLREAQWTAADAVNGEHAGQARMIEFAQRLDGLADFRTVPVGTPTTEPARTLN